MTQAKKLIEVAMPIKEISAESVRDKSIRHGHISTLHLWWARRPLPVCRAVVFASLVPDPEDENCPQAFKDAVGLLLGRQENNTDPYKPYDDIPYTSAIDKMEDTLRNRLMMFIGKFSEKYIHAAKQGKSAAAKDMLSDASLIKWDNKNDDTIIGKARKLIWVSHNAGSGKTAKELLKDFDTAYKAIKDAEAALYSLSDRHIETEKSKQLTDQLQNAIDAFQNKMPKVFDPFAGGGAIPLEAARLGCKTYGNDINPVAHIIQKGSLEFPQKYGKPITYSNAEFVKLYGEETLKTIPNEWKTFSGGNAIGVRIPNRLSFDVEFYAKKLLAETEKEIGHLYPADEKGNKPIAYYWARIGTCNNPSCKAEVPLLRGFSLCNKIDRKFFLNPIIEGNQVSFEVVKRIISMEGYNKRGNLKCPCCGSITDVNQIKEQNLSGDFKLKLLAIISESEKGKTYRSPSKFEEDFFTKDIEVNNVPTEFMQRNSAGGDLLSWGITKWGQVFSKRQLLVLTTLTEKLVQLKHNFDVDNSYNYSVVTYLGIFIDRVAAMSTSFGLWKDNLEAVVTPFSRQAIPIVFDFPEVNIFSNSTGSASNQLEWMTRFIESESSNSFHSILKNASSGEKNQFDEKFITSVVTDPPYYDAIAYADISDFFYVWLKRTLSDLYPMNFGTPQTPKTEECTALKHHHNGSITKAKAHFENKLLQIFDAIEHQTSDLVSIMFAHQSTEAWTTLCNSILGARMNITGSWAIDSERAVRGVALAGAALSSSVTVSCKPSQRQGYGEYKEVKKAIEKTVAKEVEELYRLGFRGADLLTACFGQAVSEFGKYEKVEKADGSEVTVAELLEMARESAFNALLKGFVGDDFTKFYIAWLQLYGFIESDFDDAAKFSRVGLSINVQELFTDHILIKNGNKQALGGYKERIAASKNLGDKADSHLIDQVHRAMHLYQGSNRGNLLEFIHRVAFNPDGPFWRVLTSLCEILPGGSDDHKQATGLIANKESLIRESATAQKQKASQSNLFE
jgi:putative DNA methylase